METVTDRLRLAVDRVMGEAGLWAPELAARAIRQAEGDVVEAAHLLRAYRSTRSRLARGRQALQNLLDTARRARVAVVPSSGRLLYGALPLADPSFTRS